VPDDVFLDKRRGLGFQGAKGKEHRIIFKFLFNQLKRITWIERKGL
jgi:hypothetical protein